MKTDRDVKAQQPPASGRAEVRDGVHPHLVLRVTPAGAKSWCVRYQSPVTGKQERATLGSWPDVTIREARAAAKRVRAQATLGRCVRTEEREARAARKVATEHRPTTFAQVAAAYLEQQKQRITSWPNIDAALRNHLLPEFGATPVADLRRGDIHRLLDRLIAQGRRGAAREAKKHAHALLRWAHSRELVEVNVAYDLHVPELRKRPGEEAGRALDDDELRALWICAGRMGYPWQPLLRLLVLTGCRKMEVAGLRWSAVDLRGRRFTIARDKSGNERTVPLSAPALDELRACRRFVGPADPAVFSSTHGATHVSPGSFNRVRDVLRAAMEEELGRPVPPFRPAHDYRVTAATRLSQLGVPREWVEAVEGRAAPALHAVYNKNDFEAESRRALDLLGQHVMEVVGGQVGDAEEVGEG